MAFAMTPPALTARERCAGHMKALEPPAAACKLEQTMQCRSRNLLLIIIPPGQVYNRVA
jgi:hypothetical protein